MGNKLDGGAPVSVQVRIKQEQMDRINRHLKNPNYRGNLASMRVKKMTRKAQLMEEFINDYFELQKKYKKIKKKNKDNQLQLTQKKLNQKIKEVKTLQKELVTMIEEFKKTAKFKQNEQ